MNKYPNDDSSVKFLKLKTASHLEDGQDSFVKRNNNQTALRWYGFLITVVILATGTWFLFNSIMPNKVSLDSTQSNPVTQPLPSPVPLQTTDRKLADHQTLQQPSNQALGPKADSVKTTAINTVISSESFLVVTASTKSLDEAISYARSLHRLGHDSKIILSTSGYYGVVLTQETYEQAQSTIKALTAAGAIKEKPYLMTADRVTKVIPYNPE